MGEKMKAKMDKLKNKIKANNKLIIFLITLAIIGVIAGTIFSLIINSNDKILVSDYLKSFFNAVNENNINYLETLKNSIFDNFSISIIIWLLGISIIGIPVILILFFSKTFIIGFTIGSLIINYKIKGCLIALIYIFPHQIINIYLYLLLIIYSIAFSVKLIYSLIKRKNIDFKPIINKYLFILLICLIGFLLTSLYETFLMPKFISLIIPLIQNVI